MSGRSTTLALACSLAAHAALLAVAGLSPRAASAVEAPAIPDRWAGDTFDLNALLPRGSPAAALPGASGADATGNGEQPSTPSPEVGPPEAVPVAVKREAKRAEAPRAKDTHRASAREATKHKKPAAGASNVAAASPSASSVATAGQEGAGTGSGTAGSSGAAGVGGVRNLAVAFTRAIPMAVSGDPVWGKLRLGDAGKFDLRIEVDDAGKIVSAAPTTSAIAPHLAGLVQRTLPFLRAGRFALSHANVEAGVQTLEVSVSLSEVAGGVPDDESSAGPYALGFEPPSGGRPGRAYFTLRSGRHVEVLVKVVDSG